ncbi:hypothetical protein IMZ48_35640 [Candidatus Bathyarchaeota archaeon]|nr:hypothetical protein [Candidatus Bathyarchaeota archaeon]
MSPGCEYPEKEQPLGPLWFRDVADAGHFSPAAADPDMGQDIMNTQKR